MRKPLQTGDAPSLVSAFSALSAVQKSQLFLRLGTIRFQQVGKGHCSRHYPREFAGWGIDEAEEVIGKGVGNHGGDRSGNSGSGGSAVSVKIWNQPKVYEDIHHRPARSRE